MKRRGQGLSITTIIVAAIALIVLVVLIAVFTGQIGKFVGGVSEEANTELIKVKINYGDCHPSAKAEGTFLKGYSAAVDDGEKSSWSGDYNGLISHCNTGTTSDACSSLGAPTLSKDIDPSCSWK